MSRQELEQEIRKRLYKDNDHQTIDEIFCQGCGDTIDGDHIVREHQEHGSDESYDVHYCDEKCESQHIEDMFERDKNTY